jgi:hypothetical protein
VLAAALGVVFIGAAAAVVAVTTPLTWQPVVGAGAILLVGIDLVLGAVRNRWPILASALFLP